jgi:uncharacterized protein
VTGPKRGARATRLVTLAPIRWSEDVRWLERAAERGHVPAQKDLAWRYLRGIGVRPDMERAKGLWERATGQVPSSYVGLHRWAAKRGDPAAMHELGCFALDGVGMRKDLRRAVAWLRKAAELGNLEAPSYLDLLARKGVVTARSVVPFLRRAAASGDGDAQLALGLRLENGEGVRRNVPESVRWYREAARKGEALAWLWLGHAYKDGRGARQSWARALACYRRAAAKGEGEAFAWLYEYYDGHQGVPRDTRAAAAWLRRAESAARRGETDVCPFLDDVYGYGFVDDPRKGTDPRRAVRWVRLGAAANDPACLMRLGIHLFDGTGVRQDRRRGLALYRRAAELGDERAAYLLGRCYLDGDGARRDRRRARRWLERAAKGGERGARRALARLRRS